LNRHEEKVRSGLESEDDTKAQTIKLLTESSLIVVDDVGREMWFTRAEP